MAQNNIIMYWMFRKFHKLYKTVYQRGGYVKVEVRKEVLSLSPYPAGKPISEVKRSFGITRVIKLASNENPLGCSPKAREVLLKACGDMNLYPDASVFELKNAIAAKYGVSPDMVICSSGLDLLIRVICMTVINRDDESISGEVSFSRYDDAVNLMGGRVIHVPMKNFALDVESMVNAIGPRTRVIWFCNPNNPTGTIITRAEIEKALSRIPENVLVVVDEAYSEFADREDYPECLQYIDRFNNLIVLKTFSKAYGLAGLRVGYGICCSEMSRYLYAVTGPFDVNLAAQLTALAALSDAEFLKNTQEVNRQGREYLYQQFEEIGLSYIKSQGNFIAVNVGCDDRHIYSQLLRRGIIVKPGSSLKMPGYLRVSIGSMKDNEIFIDTLKSLLKAQ